MRAERFLATCLVLAVLFCCESPAPAQSPPAKPATLWQFLGIPQTFRRSYDGIVNRRGERPNLERKPPLKALADPANLASDNPAIKAAAEIKQQEDLKPQKIKAIKYLAVIACGCYPGVKESLLAALDDCTEEVRYEAAVAFCRAAGNPCSLCNRATCCDPKVKEKLKDMALGTDSNNCYKEPSARVRAAANMALRACDQIPIPAEAPKEKKEGPTEPNGKETGEGVLRGLEAPMPPVPTPTSPQAKKASPVFSQVSLPSAKSDSPDSPDSPDILPGESTREPGYAIVQYSGSRAVPCQCARCRRWSGRVVCPTAPMAPEAPEIAEAAPYAPGVEEPGVEPAAPSPAPSALAGTFGAARAPASAAPYMIGDMFGSYGSASSFVQSYSFSGLRYDYATGYTIMGEQTRVAFHDPEPQPEFPIPIINYNDASARLGGPPLSAVPAGGTLVSGETSYDGPDGGDYDYRTGYTSAFDVRYFVPVVNPGSGGVVGKLKIAENTSPMPRDRLIFDYSYFDNVPLYPGGVNVNRFVLGFEKTFCRGAASFELKAPMASTLDSDLTIGETPGFTSGEFGNMLLTFKALLVQTETMAFSGGLSVGVPTADSTRVGMVGRPLLIEIDNQSTHVAPFVGWLWTPNDCFFAHAFLQYDVDTNGSPVRVDRGNGLAHAGRLTDSTFQYFDVGIGQWVYRNEGCPGGIEGVAWTAELHWNLALQDADYVHSGDFLIGQPMNNVEVFTAVLGAHFQFEKSTLTVGYGTPLGGGADQEFDGELRVMFNRHFGRTTRASRTPSML
ncbi:MAG: hypothetical protein ACOX1P_05350 [Thermoguttaceae bacterium]|jgi:hypothetical protein